MEAALLSRLCGKRLVATLETAARLGWHDGSFRVRFVRGISSERLGPDLSHVVLTWEGADGVRASAGRCMCGQATDPAYGEG